MNRIPRQCNNTSGKIAKARTLLTIASDRLGCSEEEYWQMRNELYDVLSKYMNLNETVYKIQLDIIYERNQGVQDVKTIQIR